MRGRRIVLAALVALPALAPGTSLAARQQTFGSKLNKPPTNFDPPATCDTSGANMDVGPCTRVAIGFANTGAVGGRVRSPMSGFIRRVRIRAGTPATVRLTLVRVASVDREQRLAEARAVSAGTLLRLKGRGLRAKGPIESFRVKLRVRRDDYLALEGASTTALSCGAGDLEQLIFTPPLDPFGPNGSSDEGDDCTLLVQATVKRR